MLRILINRMNEVIDYAPPKRLGGYEKTRKDYSNKEGKEEKEERGVVRKHFV